MSDVVNAAVCERAGRLNSASRERLEAIAARQDSQIYSQLAQLQKQLRYIEDKAIERDQYIAKDLQQQIKTLAEMYGVTIARLDNYIKKGADDAGTV